VSIVLTDPAIAGEIVRVIAFQAFEVADAYTKIQADDLLAIKAPLASPSFTGNVGIGTISPTAKLSLNQAYTAGSTYLDLDFNQSNYGNRTSKIRHQIDATGNGGSLVFAPNPNGDNAIERMRITSSGNVGIGTTSPSSKLSVNGIISTADNKLAIGDYLQVIGTLNPTNWYRIATFSNSNSPSGAEIEVIIPHTHNSTIIKLDKGTNNWRAEVYRAGYYVDPAASSAYIGINKVRVVDIGTNNYTHVDIQIVGSIFEREYRLIVKSSVSGTASTRVSLEALVDQGTAAAGVEFQAIGVMQSWGNESGQLVTIEESGNVGIGITNPSTLLTLKAEGSNVPHYSGYTTGGTHIYSMGRNGNNGLGISAYDTITFRTGATTGFLGGDEAMRIDSSGRITTPYQPAFQFRAAISQALASGWDKVLYTGNVSQRGGTNFDSTLSRFTAPVSGYYHFSASLAEMIPEDNDGTFSFAFNGDPGSHKGTVTMPATGGNYMGRSLSSTIYLGTNDYIEVYRYSSVATTVRGSHWGGTFSGHLLG